MSKMPETSQEAKAEKTKESLRKDYERIRYAYENLGEGNYDDVALFLEVVDKNSISRRMKEMREVGLLENTGRKSKTSRGRNAFIHKLTGTVLPKIKPKPPTIKAESPTKKDNEITSVTVTTNSIEVINVVAHTRSKKIIEPEKKERFLFGNEI